MSYKFPRTIGIVGYGDFGRFLHRLCREFLPDTEVRVFSRSEELGQGDFFSLAEVCQSDVLILSVPISSFASVLEEIEDLVGLETVVCDVATVKMHTVEILRQSGIKNFIATHPMFGPYSYEKHGGSLKDLRITLCDHSLTSEKYIQTKVWLQTLGLKVLEMSAESHDKLVAETLFLTHLVGQIVKRGVFERTAIDTVSFGFLMDAVESVMNDEVLFKDVFKYNPFCREVLEKFHSGSDEVASLLENA